MCTWVETAREGVDLAACIIHSVLLIAVCVSNRDRDGDAHWGSAAGICLIMMQLVAIAAHAFYYARLRMTRNQGERFEYQRNLFKWGEYAVSATLGTAALYLSATNPIPHQTITLLVVLSVTIQTVGVTLDQVKDDKTDWVEVLQWFSAAAGQGADFAVVYDAIFNSETLNWCESTKQLHYIPYVLGWSSFGILAFVTMVWYRPANPRYNSNIELVYSVLSLLSKTIVFGVTGSFLHAEGYLPPGATCL